MKILVCLVGVMWFVAVSHAEDHCSLIVKVVNSQGGEVAMRVLVEEQDGRRQERKATEYRLGGIKFCDLGILPVTVTVGSIAECGQTVVRRVPLTWGKTVTVTAMYISELCPHSETIAAGFCEILFRFVDPEHRAVPGLALKIEVPREENLQGDQFGRVFVSLETGKKLSATASADGYLPTAVRQECTGYGLRGEQYVTMKKVE